MRKNMTKALRALERGETMRDSSVSVRGDTLYSYTTAIAVRVHATLVVLNVSKYSTTTSAQQNAIAYAYEGISIERVDDLDRGVQRETLLAHAMRQKVQLVQSLDTIADHAA